MKGGERSTEDRVGGSNGGYVNHGLNGSRGSLDMGNSNGIRESRHEIQGSSDFILVEEQNDLQEKKSPDGVFKTSVTWARRRARAVCTKKMLYKRLPVLKWLPNYNTQDALGDLVAGVTVGLTVIPQSLAYSNIAGLAPQYGLYGSFLGCFIYIIFGSCKDIPFGPTAIVSLLTYQTVAHLDSPYQYAILLTFLSGVIELLMGIFGLGFLIDFVSGPVSSGFTSAVALIIVSSQVKDLLGISASGSTFVQMWKSISENLTDTSAWDATLGASCIALLLILRMVASIKIGPEDEELRTTKHRVINKVMWLIGTSRNALLVIICGILGYSFTGTPPFQLTGYIPGGMPTPQLPPFGYTKDDNTTVSFFEMCSNLGSGILVVPLISLMENIAICKAFANGKTVDAGQELIAIGISNIGNSFVQAFPSTGSLSRSAVNNASGVRTPMGGLYTGLLVILALLFLTPYFNYIPKASLAAIIIAAVIFMVEVKVVRPMWRAKSLQSSLIYEGPRLSIRLLLIHARITLSLSDLQPRSVLTALYQSDLIPGIATFVACLVLQVEIGILCGIGINVLFILYHAARPKISVEELTSARGVEYLMLTPDRCLIFPSVDYVRNLVTKYSSRVRSIETPVVIDCTHIYGADFTAAKVIESLTRDFAARGQPLFFYNLKPSVHAVFEGVAPTDFVVYYTQSALDDLLKQSEPPKLPKEFSAA